MMRHAFKVAIRSLSKQKMFTLLNGLGLALGLAGFMLIGTYVLHELSYDRFHLKADRIYRVDSHIRVGDSQLDMAQSSDMMGATLQADYPEVESYTRIYVNGGPKLIEQGNHWLEEARVAHVDSTFFRIFTYSSLNGNLQTALNDPGTVVLSESAAKRYFGSTDVVGKSLKTNDAEPLYEIKGVIADMPENSHFQFDFMFSMENAPYTNWGAFLSHNFHTYFLLKEGANYKALEQNLEPYIQKYCLPEAQQFMQLSSMEVFREQGNQLRYTLRPLTDIHLHSNLAHELAPNGHIQYVYIFGAISVFILLIACINFMNLSLARQTRRARGIAVRKVLGSTRWRLISGFLLESILLSAVASIFALILVYLSLPVFNEISGKSLVFGAILNWTTLPFLTLIVLLTGLIAGAYPAWCFSVAEPIKGLKGTDMMGARKSPLRNVLVVFQFATSIILIIGTLVVARQLNFIQDRPIGYDRENVLIVDHYQALGVKAKAFRQEALKLQGVRSGTISGFYPVSASSRSDHTFSTEAVMLSNNALSMQTWNIDESYIPTLGLQMHVGRNFDSTRPADSTGVILNQTAVKGLGLQGNIPGQRIYLNLGEQTRMYHIVGVVEDFNFESLRDPVTPLAFFLKQSPYQAAFKLQTSDYATLIAQLEHLWDDMAPGYPFSYHFMDDAFDSMYRSEQQTGLLSLSFSAMAIGIACLGLLGLAVFTAEQRTKEIGVRKVLGASVRGIVRMLTKDSLALVLIAFVIAGPIAWWMMNWWLEDFTYRINIEWWIFGVAGLTALFVALFTVGFQAFKAARANPVQSLKEE